MRVLVTGGAGFIGSHLTESLVSAGHDVMVLDDLSTGRLENIEHLIADGSVELTVESAQDPLVVDELMLRADACFHLASSVGVKLIVDQPLESVLRTVRSTDNVLGAAARHGTRLLFTSTSEVYGKSDGKPLRESADRVVGPPTLSRWSYSTAKVFGEILAYGYSESGAAPMTVARLFNSVGPRQSSAYGMVLPRFVRQALAGEDLTVYGSGSQSRCFTHVNDTVDALRGLIASEHSVGGVYNVGASEPITILELARHVIERTGSSSHVQLVAYEDAYGPGFEELGSRRPDCRKIERLIGWRPTRTLDDAIDDVIAHESPPVALWAAA
ncbi:MAG: GDP-mannose 4,6-dehydratase [Actinomycetota bacterium]|nr:GDP-mannose 4,6-dehydratase [Actinomycetota bacterium]